MYFVGNQGWIHISKVPHLVHEQWLCSCFLQAEHGHLESEKLSPGTQVPHRMAPIHIPS